MIGTATRQWYDGAAFQHIVDGVDDMLADEGFDKVDWLPSNLQRFKEANGMIETVRSMLSSVSKLASKVKYLLLGSACRIYP